MYQLHQFPTHKTEEANVGLWIWESNKARKTLHKVKSGMVPDRSSIDEVLYKTIIIANAADQIIIAHSGNSNMCPLYSYVIID
jgi:hypothetical protein